MRNLALLVWAAAAAVVFGGAAAYVGTPLSAFGSLGPIAGSRCAQGPASSHRHAAVLQRQGSGAVWLRAQASEPGWDDEDSGARRNVRPGSPRPSQRKPQTGTISRAPRSVSPTLVGRRPDSPIPTRIGLANGTNTVIRSSTSTSSRGTDTRNKGTATLVDQKVSTSTIAFFKPVNASIFPGKGKPLLLYIPGLDGMGGTADPQFRDLSRNYDVRCMRIKPEDRTSFDSLTRTVSRYIAYFQRTASPEKAMIMGEGLGGMIALAVGLESPALLQGIVTVNPATSFDRSVLNTFLSSAPLAALGVFAETVNSSVPFLNQKIGDVLPASLNLPRSEATLTDLAFSMFSAPLMVAQTFDAFRTTRQANRTLSRVRAGGVQGVQGVTRSAQEQISRLVSDFGMEASRHKFEVLNRGCEWVNPRLSMLAVPVLALAGDQDRLLPSANEVLRLSKMIPTCKMAIIHGGGHLPLDDRVNVTKLILDSPAASKALRYDPVLDFRPPTAKEIKDAQFQLMPFKKLTSPVFYSTRDGQVVEGLSGLPAKKAGKPILFVGNHQLWGLDSSLLVEGVYEQSGTLLRGLAHPFVMQEGMLAGLSRAGGKNPLQTFGAVAVNPKNYYTLLSTGSDILLYPGGAAEAFNTKAAEYPLDWPEKADFVRLAAKFNAVIVPFGGVGCSDLGKVIDLALNRNLSTSFSSESKAPASGLRNVIPMLFGGEDAMNRVMQRFGVPGLNDDRLSFSKAPPLFIPNPPFATPRFYYKFATPISTDNINPEDKEMCLQIYEEAKASVRESIDYLVEKRKEDPYRNQVARFTYESTRQTQAPSFDP